jgi:hypothetical protein
VNDTGGFMVNGEWFDDLRFTDSLEQSRVVVDVVLRAEVDALRTEVRRLAATLDVVQADRDEWHSAWVGLARASRAIAARLADTEAALERARGLAVRAGAFDTGIREAGPIRWVTAEREGIPEAPRLTLGDQSADQGPDTLPTDLDGLEAERDDGR